METGKYDFLQFGANIIPEGNVSDDMIQLVDNFMNPEEMKDITGDILRACFIEHKFNCNLVNKIWRNDLCKKRFFKDKRRELRFSGRQICIIHFVILCEFCWTGK